MQIDMIENCCPNNPGFGHGYKFWELSSDGKNAIGTCKFCDKKIPRAITKGIIQNIEMQEIAKVCLDDFFKEDIEDVNILLHLAQVLNNFFNYINDDTKKLLDAKMCQLISSSVIGKKNEDLISKLIISIRNDDNESFFDLLETFKEYNMELLMKNSQEKTSYLR